MEHVKETIRDDGSILLTPHKNYMLKFDIVDNLFSEAVVKSTKGWKAVHV